MPAYNMNVAGQVTDLMADARVTIFFWLPLKPSTATSFRALRHSSGCAKLATATEHYMYMQLLPRQNNKDQASLRTSFFSRILFIWRTFLRKKDVFFFSRTVFNKATLYEGLGSARHQLLPIGSPWRVLVRLHSPIFIVAQVRYSKIQPKRYRQDERLRCQCLRCTQGGFLKNQILHVSSKKWKL